MRPSLALYPLLAAMALSFGPVFVAAAASKAPEPLPTYEQLDKDKDGIVTMSEVDVYPPGVAARLHRCNTDKDQQLSREEYARCEHDAPPPAKAK